MSTGSASSSPRPLPARVQVLLDGKRLRQQSFSAPNIAALWEKAVAGARDAALPALSRDTSLQAAYTAGHTAALALLAAYSLQPAGGAGHHEVAFSTAVALGGAGLEDLVADSEEVRALRKGSVYDPVIATEPDRQRAIAWVLRTLPAIRGALIACDANLDNLLKPYPKMRRVGPI
jgi:hypothetical protein